MARTAAALLIGNELLTGKVQEGNLSHLAKELFRLGVELKRVVICQDHIETIAADLVTLSRDHDYVITSGGVGPTHDDVTISAVAHAFDAAVVRSEELERRIREMVGERLNDGHLRMADVPEGAEMVEGGEFDWPTVRMKNVFVLPGIPGIFRAKLPVLRESIGATRPFLSRAIFTTLHETDIAKTLRVLEGEHPEVDIGSYPVLNEQYRVRVTFDSKDGDAIQRAVDALLTQLPENCVYRSPS